MKKVLFGAFALSVLLIACSKKENTVNGKPNIAIAADGPVDKERPKSPNSTYVTVGLSKGWCNGYPWNCTVLPDVVITAAARTLLDSAQNGDNYTVAEIFESEELTCVTDHIPLSYLNSFLVGKYYIVKSSEDSSKVCYMAGEDYPVTEENMEFAFQGSK